MLAIGRALMSRPKLIMFDEPSLGLAPNIVERTFDIITGIRDAGTTVLMVEQNASAAFDMCDHAYLLESGSLALSGSRPRIDRQPARAQRLSRGVIDPSPRDCAPPWWRMSQSRPWHGPQGALA